jgi:hypothetical protein
VVVSDDVKNCHSELPRHQVAAALSNVEHARNMIPGLTADLQPAQSMFLRSPNGSLEPFTQEDGVTPISRDSLPLEQGFPPSGAICSLQLLPHSKAANAILAPSGGRSRGYQDDHRHVGPIDEALAAAKCFNDGIKSCLGLDVKPIKCMVYSSDLATRADLRTRGVTLGIVRADGS